MKINFYKNNFSRWCCEGNEVWKHYEIIISAFGWTIQFSINSPTKIIPEHIAHHKKLSTIDADDRRML